MAYATHGWAHRWSELRFPHVRIQFRARGASGSHAHQMAEHLFDMLFGVGRALLWALDAHRENA